MPVATEPPEIRLVRQGKRAVLTQERDLVREITARWLEVERSLDPQVRLLAQELRQAQASGQKVTRSRLQRNERYVVILSLLSLLVQGFTTDTETRIRSGIRALAEIGESEARSVLEAQELALPTSQPGEVSARVAAAEAKRPVSGMLEEVLPDAADGLTSALVIGLGLGWALGKLLGATREGLSGGLNRALLIGRDQGFRAYRLGADYTYQESGEVKFRMRVTRHDSSVCLACLSRDRELLPVDSPTYDHPAGRCSFTAVPAGYDYRKYEGGEAWFKMLGQDQQRAMLGPTRFKAWSDGTLNFNRLAKDRFSKTYGRSLRVARLSELRIGGEGI